MKRPICFSLAMALAAVAPVACHRADPPDNVSSARTPAPHARTASTTDATQPAVASAPATSQRQGPRDAMSDSIISARIKAGILSDPGMTGADVSVNTDRGVVSLTGLVKSQEQAAIASAHAQRQDGVMRVDNELAVNLH